MKLSEQMAQVRSALETWIKDYGGEASIAADPADLFERLSLGPGKLRALVWPARGEKRGEHEEAGMEDRTFWVVLSRGRGFALEQAQHLWSGAPTQKALWDLVEEARDIVRALSFDAETTEVTPDFRGWQPFTLPTQVPVDAYQLEFSIGTQLPAIETTGDQT